MDTEIATKNNNTAPSLRELHFDLDQAKSRDGLNNILNIAPKKEWIKDHPTAAGVKYIPIDKIEYLLRRIFQRTKIEVIDFKVLANAVCVHVRLHYIDPVDGQWDFQDGLGAVGIQVEKGSAATDFTKIRHDAIMKNLPAAESYAIKDAAEKLGKLFGADLNRKDEIAFSGTYTDFWNTATTKK